MAEVWLAKHEVLGVDMAIKFLDRSRHTSEADLALALQRFRFEAELSAQLAIRTRNVVAVIDADSHEGIPFLVMEYLTGQTLAERIADSGRLAPAVLAVVLDRIADALTALHALGVVHRDIKPSNILLQASDAMGESSPVAKLGDFGVAKAAHDGARLRRAGRETSPGLLVGSPAYMSPESIMSAESADARSDLWSLAVVAYEALTGYPPFMARTFEDTVLAILDDPVEPPSKIVKTLPRALDAWFERALARDLDARFQTPAEMTRAYREALGSSARRARRALACAGVVASGAMGVLLALRSPPEPTALHPGAAAAVGALATSVQTSLAGQVDAGETTPEPPSEGDAIRGAVGNEAPARSPRRRPHPPVDRSEVF